MRLYLIWVCGNCRDPRTVLVGEFGETAFPSSVIKHQNLEPYNTHNRRIMRHTWLGKLLLLLLLLLPFLSVDCYDIHHRSFICLAPATSFITKVYFFSTRYPHFQNWPIRAIRTFTSKLTS